MPKKNKRIAVKTTKTVANPIQKQSSTRSKAQTSKKADSEEAQVSQPQETVTVEDINNGTVETPKKSDQEELQQLKERKAENSKRVLYKALVRERNLNGEKPSVLVNEASKTGHNFSKTFSALSADQRHERVRLLAGIVAEFADPKSSSEDKTEEVKALVESLQTQLTQDPLAFQ